MKRFSFQRVSILSLVLLAASAVTAAVLPSSGNKANVTNGTLRTAPDQTSTVGTCRPRVGADTCQATASNTSVSGNESDTTADNTTT